MRVVANDLLFALSKALDCVEHELLGVTTNHSKRVALVSTRLCLHLGLSSAEVTDMASCAVLHDNALTEYTHCIGRHAATKHEQIERHCTLGEEQARHFPFLGNVDNVILHHHENWDGSGFFHLAGPEISIRASALRLADNTDLLLRMGTGGVDQVCTRARAHVTDARETLYHPELADVFLSLCNDAFVADLADATIDTALKRHIPAAPCPLTLEKLLEACELFSGITDAKSPFTASHCRCMAERAANVAATYDLAPDHLLQLRIAAHLHDVGKLVIAPEILEKPAPLTPEEYEIMKGHVAATHALLQNVPGLEKLSQWAVQHHEKLDGSGYPYGLTMPQLGFESRLLACVDVYQALVEDRPYRKGMPHKQAIDILRGMASECKLDADIVERLAHA